MKTAKSIYLRGKPEAEGIRVATSLPNGQGILHVYADRDAFRIYIDVEANGKLHLCGLSAKANGAEVFTEVESVQLTDVNPANFRFTSQFGVNYNSIELGEGDRRFTVTYDDVYRSVIAKGDVSVLQELIRYLFF